MSWWLSTPIQRHLHQQTEDTKNENDNADTLNLVWNILGHKSDCGPCRGGSGIYGIAVVERERGKEITRRVRPADAA